MPSTPHRELPPELCEELNRIRQRPASPDDPGISERELDNMLAVLDPEQFEHQLQALIVELGPLRLHSSRRRDVARKNPGLPSGGISRAYLKDVAHFSTMTRHEETVYARRMEFVTARLEAAEFQSRGVRSARRAEYLRVRGDFVARSLHLVVSEAYSYRTYGVPMDDLIQEGNTALMRAVEKFDWRHQVRFRTYVSYWIRQAIERYLAAQKGAVRVPHHLQQKFRRLKREGQLPHGTDEDISARQMAEAFEITPQLAAHLLESSRPSFSLDQELTKEGETYRDFLVTDWEPMEIDQDSRLQSRIRHLLGDLDEREQTVLRMRFGLDGARVSTLEEVGVHLSLSRERSRQIQQKALAKLLKSAKDKHLEDFL